MEIFLFFINEGYPGLFDCKQNRVLAGLLSNNTNK